MGSGKNLVAQRTSGGGGREICAVFIADTSRDLCPNRTWKGLRTGEIAREVEVCLSMMPQGIENFTALDIGANTGNWTSALLEKNNQVAVYSFEPSRQAYEALNLKFRGDERQRSVRLAFGAAPGRATLWADRAGSGLGSLVQRDLAHLGLDFGYQESVEVESLDRWCEEAGVHPSLVKLDVEGYELEVIRGGQKTLQSVSVLQFEFGGCNVDSRVLFRDFYSALRDLGFKLARITPRGTLAITRYDQSCEVFETTNYVAYR